MKRVYSPGCALMIYQPQRGRKILELLNNEFGAISEHLTCCRHEPDLPPGTQIINTCAGCDKRFSTLYQGITTISLWELLAESKKFPFPDYRGCDMTILDACPTRKKSAVHDAIRMLLKRMNINLIEPEKTRDKGACCGDSFYGKVPSEKLKKQMIKRAAEMPCRDVVVYCVSCCNSMFIGGKQPRYLVDLLLDEPTVRGIVEPDAWHVAIDEFIIAH